MNALLNEASTTQPGRESHDDILSRQERLATVGHFVTAIAHDLNNMLAVITGATDELHENIPGCAALDDLSASVAHGTALVHKLLSFARQRPSPQQVVVVADAIDRMLPLLRRLVGPEITIVVGHMSCPLSVLIDRTGFDQVILNVVTNARDAMSEGGVITITTRASAGFSAGAVEIEVADTGSGIAPAVIGSVLEPFVTTRGDQGGTGLGLATVDSVTRAAGGEVSIRSDPGSGSVITMRLPALPPQP